MMSKTNQESSVTNVTVLGISLKIVKRRRIRTSQGSNVNIVMVTGTLQGIALRRRMVKNMTENQGQA
jgi:hypothetical protein